MAEPRPRAASPQEQLFVQRYLVHGNGAQAAREAGFKAPYWQRGNLLMERKAVLAELERVKAKQLADEAASKKPLTRAEAKAILAHTARTGPAKESTRAIAQLCRMEPGWEVARKLEHSGPDGADIPFRIPTRQEAMADLREAAEHDPVLRADLDALRSGGEP